MATIDEQIIEHLGLVTADTGIALGNLKVMQSQDAVALIVTARNAQVNKLLSDALAANPELEAEDKAKFLSRLLLTFDEYLYALKNIDKLKREQAEISAATAQLDYAKSTGLYDDLFEARDRMNKHKRASGMDERYADRTGQFDSFMSAKLYKIQGLEGRDKETVESIKDQVGDLRKMELDTRKKRVMQRYLYDEGTRSFSELYRPIIHTSDWQGYLAYIRSANAKLADNLAAKTLPAALRENDRQRHTYIVGGTGSGKSELMKSLVHAYTTGQVQSAAVIIDPHGDLTRQIAEWREFENSDRLAYLEPRLDETGQQSFTINPLQTDPAMTPQDREVMAQQITGAFEELLKGSGGAALSVNMRAVLMPCLLTLLDAGDKTLVDLQTFLNDDHNEQLVALGKASPRKAIARFFEREFHDRNFTITKQSLRTKLQSLFNSEIFYNIVNGRTTFDIEQAIEQRKIILFSLSKGLIGNDASEALGRFVLALIQGMALRRQTIAEEQRVPVHVFIDECQNYIGASTVTILEEARKYGVHLTLAQQVAGRGMTPEIRTVVLNNTAIKLVGRTAEDQRMAKLLGLELEDIQQLQVGQFYCRAGSHATCLIAGATDLIGQSNSMGEEQWRKVKANQLTSYYRKQNSSTPPESDVELI